MPPEQAGGLHPDAQLVDMMELGQLGQRGRQGLSPWLGIRDGPVGRGFGPIGEQKADAGVILGDIQPDKGERGHSTTSSQCRSGRSRRGRRHNIRACDQNSRAWEALSTKLLPLVDPTPVEPPGGQKSTSHPEQTVYRERSVSHGGGEFVPTGYTA